MHTWCIAFTLINIFFTLEPLEAILTFTFIASYGILAGSMGARIWITLVHINLTVLTNDSWYTDTLVPKTDGAR
jgi:hypothetical protein